MWILKTLDAPEGTGPFTFRVMPGSIKTLGRAARADFVVDVPLVSRFQCRFTASAEGGLLLEDLESTNGTLVNDKRVEKVALTQGDRVRVGRVELGVERG
ncbi:MAG: FHA domain-containing protein [Vicinamibacteria bacterium]|nr:FHA domain-containing protein [Vicinamibacteria bacterium]